METNAEKNRLAEQAQGQRNWKFFGPYLSERQWGTVREDYSPHGNAWEYFSHDHARSRAYRWGEDGIAGISDEQQRLCFSLAMWNGNDPILKERLFGLTNGEGNHGEDVKEVYYYLDATPTHSYLKMLYKYPQREFPYVRLVEENRRRGKDEPEFELLDTGVFDDDRYFDVFVEYSKAGPEDLLILLTVHNRGPEAATIHLLPQLWFRNTWSWKSKSNKPELSAAEGAMVAKLPELGEYRLYCEAEHEVLFCDNETNVRRLHGQNDAAGFFKDAFHEYVIGGKAGAVNPKQIGTKAAAHVKMPVAAQSAIRVRLRLCRGAVAKPFALFEKIFKRCRAEADEFYAELQRDISDADARAVQRQAFAGMIWSKQFFYYDVPEWIKGDAAQPAPPSERKRGRNRE